MDIDKKLVKKIATLSRVKIEEKEVERFSKELSKIITWVEKLNEVDTKDVIPVANPSDIKIPFREDEQKKKLVILLYLKSWSKNLWI